MTSIPAASIYSEMVLKTDAFRAGIRDCLDEMKKLRAAGGRFAVDVPVKVDDKLTPEVTKIVKDIEARPIKVRLELDAADLRAQIRAAAGNVTFGGGAGTRPAGGGGGGGSRGPADGGDRTLFDIFEKLGTTATPDRIAESLKRFFPGLGVALGAVRVAQFATDSILLDRARDRAIDRGDLAGEVKAEEKIRDHITSIPIFGSIAKTIWDVREEGNVAAIEKAEWDTARLEKQNARLDRRVAEGRAFNEQARAHDREFRVRGRANLGEDDRAQLAVADQRRDLDEWASKMDPGRRLDPEVQQILARGRAGIAAQEAALAWDRTAREKAQLNEWGGLAARARGDTDAARRIELQGQLGREEEAARKESPAALRRFREGIAPQRQLILEQEINRERTREARQSEDRVAAVAAEAGEEMLRARGRVYEADAAALRRSVAASVKALRDRADAEADATRRAQLNAEADAEERAGAERVKAQAIRKTRDVELEVGRIRAETNEANLRAQRRFVEADNAQFDRSYDDRIKKEKVAGEDQAAEALQQQKIAAKRERDATRQRQTEEIQDEARLQAQRNAHKSSTAELNELELRARRASEDAQGDPARQAALRQKEEADLGAFIERHRRFPTAQRGSMADFYAQLQATVIEGPNSRRMVERADELRATNTARDRLQRMQREDDAAAKKARDDAENAKKFGAATDKFEKAADKLANAQAVGIVSFG